MEPDEHHPRRGPARRPGADSPGPFPARLPGWGTGWDRSPRSGPGKVGSSPARPQERRWKPVSGPELVGSDSCRATLAEHEHDRADAPDIEFLDSAVGRAWIPQDGPAFLHQDPLHRLTVLGDRIAPTRGYWPGDQPDSQPPIRCRAAGGLRLLGADTRRAPDLRIRRSPCNRSSWPPPGTSPRECPPGSKRSRPECAVFRCQKGAGSGCL